MTSVRESSEKRISIPVQTDDGMHSRVYDHFGSAPLFVIMDTEANEVVTIRNRDAYHAHGACNPNKALDGRSIDAVVVVGIGAGALTKLNRQGSGCCALRCRPSGRTWRSRPHAAFRSTSSTMCAKAMVTDGAAISAGRSGTMV